jgi:RNA polymerase sigma-70 factor, ECF subfamily
MVEVCPFAPSRYDSRVNETSVVASSQDLETIQRLLVGDEKAFLMLVDQHHATMLRIAQMYVSSRAVAEEAVQDAWLGILKGLSAFEGRSSLRTWMYRILMNVAKTRGAREGRSVPFSALSDDAEEDAIDPAWFQGPMERFPGGWRTFPDDWRGIPEDRLIGQETIEHIGRAMDALPPMQAEVVRLRDVLGWSSEEVCNALALSETNQRVLLHRGRNRIRRELDAYWSEGQQR